jgi:hypothetical protein
VGLGDYYILDGKIPVPVDDVLTWGAGSKNIATTESLNRKTSVVSGCRPFFSGSITRGPRAAAVIRDDGL